MHDIVFGLKLKNTYCPLSCSHYCDIRTNTNTKKVYANVLTVIIIKSPYHIFNILLSGLLSHTFTLVLIHNPDTQSGKDSVGADCRKRGRGVLDCDLLNKAGPSGGEQAYFPFRVQALNEMEIKIWKENAMQGGCATSFQ